MKAFCLSLIIFLTSLTTPTYALGPITASEYQSLTIGTVSTFTLFGYTSPRAHVTLSSTDEIASTTADANGYFTFTTISVPQKTREVCLQSIDISGLVSQPVCIAYTSLFNGHDVGPVLLSPSLSLDRATPRIGEAITIAGRTLPNAPVNLSSFIDKNTVLKGLHLYDKSFTHSLPKLEAKSDENGYFTFKFTSSIPQTTRVYASALRDTIPTAKSTTLSVTVLPLWENILRLILRALLGLGKLRLPLIILIEALILIYLVAPLLLPEKVQKAIMVYQPRSLTVLKNKIMTIHTSLMTIGRKPAK